MSSLLPFAYVFYVVMILAAMLFRGSVKVNNRPVRNPIARGLVAVVVLPFLGVVFYLFRFVGQFMLLPITSHL